MIKLNTGMGRSLQGTWLRSFKTTALFVLALFLFIGTQGLSAQTKSDLGPVSSQKVIDKISEEIDYLENQQGPEVNDYLVEAYDKVIQDFNGGADLKISLMKLVDASEELSRAVIADQRGQTEQVEVIPGQASNNPIRNLFSDLTFKKGDVSDIDVAISRIRELKNQ